MSIIEILVVIAIVGVLSVIIGKFQADIFSFNRYFNNSLSVADKAQKLLRPMTQEIRSASPSSVGAYPIDGAGAYDFSFYSDIDSDGYKDLVRYYISGTNLMKDVTKPTGSPLSYSPGQKTTTTFMTGVQNQANGIPMFTYYDSTYTGGATGIVNPSSSTIASIRMIGITIRIDESTAQPPGPIDVTSMVAIRNLKQQQ